MRKNLIKMAVIAGLFSSVSFSQVTIPDPVAVIDGKALSKVEFEKTIGPIINYEFETIRSVDELNQLVNEYALQAILVEKARKEKLSETEEFKDRMLQGEKALLAEIWIKKALDSIKISDDEVKKEYDKEIAAIDRNEYKASHILVETEEKAKEVLAKLNDKAKPMSFSDAAKEFSIDTGTKENGGALDWFKKEMMVPEFGNAVASIKKGEISQTPVKSQFGYHIILVEDTREAEVIPLDEAKSEIIQKLKQDKLREDILNLQKSMKIEYKAQ